MGTISGGGSWEELLALKGHRDGGVLGALAVPAEHASLGGRCGRKLDLDDERLRGLSGARAGRHFGYVRAVGRRRAEARMFDPLMSLPGEYTRKPLLRGSE